MAPHGLLALTCVSSLAWAGCVQPLRLPPTARAQPPPQAAPPQPPTQPSLSVERNVTLGHSVEGRPLTLTVFGNQPTTIFIFAGIHGSEPSSVDVAEGLIRHLRAHPEVCAGRTVGILPVANPDGLAQGRRANANRVDLNRNFPARNWRRSRHRRLSHGPGPASEPETQAIQRAVQLLHPDCIVSIHAISRGRQCNNYDGPARRLAQLMSRCNGYPVVADIGHPTPGSFGSWAGVDQRLPTLTLELPKGIAGEECWESNRAALLALIDAVNRPTRAGK